MPSPIPVQAEPLQPRITIALIEWHWMGHHPSYAVNFALAIAKAGFDVVPFCANPSDFTARLQALSPTDTEDRAVIHPAVQVYRAYSRIPKPNRVQRARHSINHFRILGKQLRNWCKANQATIQQAFFCCIYDVDFEHFRYAQPFFRFPWTGLYFNSRFFRLPGTILPYHARTSCPERIFSLPSCNGVAVLDPKAIPALGCFLGTMKRVVLFPDFTDAGKENNSTDQSFSLASKIRRFREGCPVISLTGHLQRTKGLHSFTKAACDSRLRDTTFFLGGEINWNEISAEEKLWLLQAWESTPNMTTHLQWLSSEAVLNQVIAASDIVYAVYDDFPNSSNILTKAALLRRPVIVGEGHLMAELVRDYELGEVVRSDDHDDICQTLLKMLEPDYLENLCNRARWKEYEALQSAARLPEAFEKLLATD